MFSLSQNTNAKSMKISVSCVGQSTNYYNDEHDNDDDAFQAVLAGGKKTQLVPKSRRKVLKVE